MLELTTDEIISKLKNRINNDQLTSINILLKRADLAKFAKSKPSNKENLDSMKLAKHFVSETKINNG